jgi:AcrR family transcriptional regulator
MSPEISAPKPVSRRDEILDAARRLVVTKGYEQMTIEDILSDVHLSKGAFYHYFGSKAALLQALVERLRDEGGAVFLPVLEDPALSALEKIQAWFDVAARWKTMQRDYLLALLRVWYHDDNAVVRQKLRTDTLAWIAPRLTEVVRQGIGEKVFSPPYPEQAGEILFSLIYELGDGLAMRILSGSDVEAALQDSRDLLAAYTDAIERALRAPAGSLRLIDPERLREWFQEPVIAA